ncbi:hypothetical protein T06_3241 [Trichinella sp. T6]|nr:hypothetical protein T06_3241 [Trichinella sp. T6]
MLNTGRGRIRDFLNKITEWHTTEEIYYVSRNYGNLDFELTNHILLINLIERFFQKHYRDEEVEFIFKKKSSVSQFSFIAVRLRRIKNGPPE